jgi:dUTP pyrophosphatase
MKIDFEIQCKMVAGGEHKNVGFFLVPRSSLVKTPLRMSNSIGIIDAHYRGNIMAFVDNISTVPYEIHAGDRLFQIVAPSLEKIEVFQVKELDKTDRGAHGFGSTGK